MEDNVSMKSFEADVSIGIVGHCSLEEVIRIKKWLSSNPGFEMIFFKTCSGKLWIKEGEYDE